MTRYGVFLRKGEGCIFFLKKHEVYENISPVCMLSSLGRITEADVGGSDQTQRPVFEEH